VEALDEPLTFTISKRIIALGDTVYALVSVGQKKTWQATPEKLRSYSGRNVVLDFGDINEQAIRERIMAMK
jgi:hypothetical protein